MEMESTNQPLGQANGTETTRTEPVSDRDLGDIVYQAIRRQREGYEGSLSRGKSAERLAGELMEAVQCTLRREGLGEVPPERIEQMAIKVEQFL